MGGTARLIVVAACLAACGGTSGDTGGDIDRSVAVVESRVVERRGNELEVDDIEAPAIATDEADPVITPRTGPDFPRRVTAAFTGDILPHSPLWTQARRNGHNGSLDFGPMFADIRAQISSVDLAVCHLETPIAPAGTAYTTHPLYGVPAEIVDGIAWSGYDRCSTASNHALDKGTAGIDRTIEVLKRAGLAQSGMAHRGHRMSSRSVA